MFLSADLNRFWLSTRARLCLYVGMDRSTCMYAYVCIQVCCMHACMHVCMYIHTYAHKCIHAHFLRSDQQRVRHRLVTCRQSTGVYGRLPATYRLKSAVVSPHSYLVATWLSCSEKRDQMVMGLTCEMMTESFAKRLTWMESASLAIWSKDRRANSGMLWRLR